MSIQNSDADLKRAQGAETLVMDVDQNGNILSVPGGTYTVSSSTFQGPWNDSAGFALFDGTTITTISAADSYSGSVNNAVGGGTALISFVDTPFFLPNLNTITGQSLIVGPNGGTIAFSPVVTLDLRKGNCPAVTAITAAPTNNAFSFYGEQQPGANTAFRLENCPVNFVYPAPSLTISGADDDDNVQPNNAGLFIDSGNTALTALTLSPLTLYGGVTGDHYDGDAEIHINAPNLANLTIGAITFTGGANGASSSWTIDFSDCSLNATDFSALILAVTTGFQNFLTANPGNTSIGTLLLAGTDMPIPSTPDNANLALLTGWTINVNT